MLITFIVCTTTSEEMPESFWINSNWREGICFVQNHIFPENFLKNDTSVVFLVATAFPLNILVSDDDW